MMMMMMMTSACSIPTTLRDVSVLHKNVLLDSKMYQSWCGLSGRSVIIGSD